MFRILAFLNKFYLNKIVDNFKYNMFLSLRKYLDFPNTERAELLKSESAWTASTLHVRDFALRQVERKAGSYLSERSQTLFDRSSIDVLSPVSLFLVLPLFHVR